MAGYAFGVHYDEARAELAVRRAANGGATSEDGRILVDLFRRATEKRGSIDAAERVANECARTFAAYLDGEAIVLSDLPEDVQRRINAYRNRAAQLTAGLPVGVRWGPGVDQFGRLPSVPDIDRVGRDKVRTVDESGREL